MDTADVARSRFSFSGRAVLRFGYLPFMLIGVNGLGLWLASNQTGFWWLLALVLVAVGASFGVERSIPYRNDWNHSHGDARRDLVHATVNELSTLMAVAILPWMKTIVPRVYEWPGQLPFVLQVGLAVVVFDVGVTLTHYVSHRVSALWRLHAVHHSVQRLYGFNGLMKHPLHQLIELSVGVTPLVLLGLPHDVGVALAFCTVVQLLLQHSNADYALGPFGKWLALNRAHRLHHVRSAAEGDVNFGLFTLLWDRMLGTFAFDETRAFSTHDLGIDGKPDYPRAYIAQIVEPFRR